MKGSQILKFSFSRKLDDVITFGTVLRIHKELEKEAKECRVTYNELLEQKLHLAIKEHKQVSKRFDNRWTPSSTTISLSLLLPAFALGLEHLNLTKEVMLTTVLSGGVCLGTQYLDRFLDMKYSLKEIMILEKLKNKQ